MINNKNNFMKHVPLIFCSIVVIIMTSCKKNEVSLTPLASLNVVAAVIGGGNLKLNYNERDSAKAYNSKVFGIVSGTSNVVIYSTSNPGKPYYDNTVETQNGDNYSLFLSGNPNGIDAVLVKDNMPAHYIDSTVGVRIVNLSPNCSPVNITLASASTTKIFSNIAYKQVSDFIQLPLLAVMPSGSVTFQVRDGISNALLTSYTLPSSVNSDYPGISVQLSRFRNITLVIKGLQGVSTGVDAFGVFPVPNY
jgi:hypothetical protein